MPVTLMFVRQMAGLVQYVQITTFKHWKISVIHNYLYRQLETVFLTYTKASDT